MSEPALSVVVPAFNEALRLPISLPPLLERIEAEGWELILVDDGSTDHTAIVAQALVAGSAHARVLCRDRNGGKGAAVRDGMLATRGRTACFMDADLATDLDGLDHLRAALETADIAIGSRSVQGSVVLNGDPSRAVLSRMFNSATRYIGGVDARDTQCGFKAFRSTVVRELFGRSRINGWAFDVEILSIARVLNLSIVEVPVVWTAVEGSAVRPLAHAVPTTWDVLRIAMRWRLFAATTVRPNCELANVPQDLIAPTVTDAVVERPAPRLRHRRSGSDRDPASVGANSGV